jgi:multiple sugar transport system ATP-binding protein
MNLLKGDVAKGGVKLADGTVLPLPAGHKGKVGQKVVYGIRPEHLKPAKAGIPAKVVVVEPTGPEIHIYADLGGQEVCAITDERLQLARDVAIKLMPKLDKVHLFDAESGEALA